MRQIAAYPSTHDDVLLSLAASPRSNASSERRRA
jgi:hypothetical protein